MTPDYTLYLVTDNTPAILGHRDILDVVKDAIEGGMASLQQASQNFVDLKP